jgi:hypothetical protein
MDDKTSIFVRGKVIAICEAILNEEIGVINGSRILDRLEFELIEYGPGFFNRDEDFLPFVASILRPTISRLIANAPIGAKKLLSGKIRKSQLPRRHIRSGRFRLVSSS